MSFFLFEVLCPLNRKEGRHIVYGADPVSQRPHSFVSVRYLLNQWMDFDQSCIDNCLEAERVD